MNPATTGLVWSNVPDAMLVSKEIQIRAKNIQTLLASVHLGNNQTFGLLAGMTLRLGMNCVETLMPGRLTRFTRASGHCSLLFGENGGRFQDT